MAEKATTTLSSDQQKEQNFQAFLKSLPSTHQQHTNMPKTTGLQDAVPFLVKVGWAKRVQSLDITQLIQAVESPAADTGDYKLFSACGSLFSSQQQIIETAYPSIRRKWMLDSMSQVIFSTLGPAGNASYTHRMVRLVTFVLRVARGLNISGECGRLNFYLTKEQKDAAKNVDAKLSGNEKGLQAAVQNLLVTIFAPTRTHHLMKNPFHDIVQDFCMLAAINRSGQFSEPKNITSPLAAMQYIMCSVLLQKAMDDSDINSNNANTSFDHIQQTYLTSDNISPYAGLQSLKAQVWTYALTSTSLPNAQWADSEHKKVIIKGKTVELEDLKRLAQQILADANHLLYEELLFGIPLSQLGWTWHPDDILVDDLSERTPGYNVFSEPKNATHFAHLQETVLRAFHFHEKTSNHFYDESGALKPAQARAWMKKWEQLNGMTALLFHILGGQPARSSELLCIYLENMVHRFRHIYWFEDKFFFIVCLNKVTNLTAKDRIIVHGLPPELTEFLLVMNGLARHVANAWTFHLEGQEAFERQKTQMFNYGGVGLTPQKFSKLLQEITEEVVGTPLGISDWRHLCVMIARYYFKLLPGEEQLEDEDENHPYDLQAGHGTKVAGRHYAIEAMEWHCMRSDTVARYIKISSEVSTWYLHDGELTNGQNKEKSDKFQGIKRKQANDSDSDNSMEDSESYVPPVRSKSVGRTVRAAKKGNHASTEDDCEVEGLGSGSDDYVPLASRSRQPEPAQDRVTRSQTRKKQRN
ncbi:hypothetical protein FRC11_010906 [Ceratobasidium sp. 423]|nr:hypothetical protein FRC11_010906 [Ceratobasidium sp. 423]